MVQEIINNFKNELDSNMADALMENQKKLGELFLNIEIIEEIVGQLQSEQNIILKEVIHDLVSGMYSSLQALYRNAYISLRSGIELTLGYVYFLDHNYDYLFWKQDQYDMKWSVLENEEIGVLSKKYLSMFSEDNFEVLFALCRKIYRDCSQFVHGKYEYMHTVKHQSVKYDKDTLAEYLGMFHDLTDVIISLLIIRHQNLQLHIHESYKTMIEEILKKLQLTDTLNKLKEYWR